MRILTVAVLSAGLAFPAVLERPPRAPESKGMQKSARQKRGSKKGVFKKAGRGLLSAALFLAEPEK